MVFCLDSKDYMQIRNALIILMRILPHFPMLVKLAQIVERKVEKVCDEERNQRKDLYLLATSYIGRLKARSNDMIREADFHQVADKPVKEPTVVVAPAAAQTSAVSAATSTPPVAAKVETVNGSSAMAGNQGKLNKVGFGFTGWVRFTRRNFIEFRFVTNLVYRFLFIDSPNFKSYITH